VQGNAPSVNRERLVWTAPELLLYLAGTRMPTSQAKGAAGRAMICTQIIQHLGPVVYLRSWSDHLMFGLGQ